MNTENNIHVKEKSATIVRKALEMFMEYGIRSVRMDDIAHSLGMSKRTIYELFEDKEELLLECVRLYNAEKDKQFKAYQEQASNPIDLIVFLIKKQMEEFSQCNPLFFIELTRYDSVRKYHEDRQENDKKMRQTVIQKGIQEGYFADDINYVLLERISILTAESLIKEQLYTAYTLQEIFQTFILVFLRGILTEKGLKDMNKYLQQEPANLPQS